MRRLVDLQERARISDDPDVDDTAEKTLDAVRNALAYQAEDRLDYPANALTKAADKMEDAAAEVRGMVEQVQDIAKSAGSATQSRLLSMAKNLAAFADQFDVKAIESRDFSDKLHAVSDNMRRRI